MIKSWEKIEERFDQIKDHKPKATKKLYELGEILTSAYKLNRLKANQMWQYIIELNVTDNGDNAKFYVAQVFRKIVEQIGPKSATDFVFLSQDRARLLLLNGYEGSNLWDTFSTLLVGGMELNDTEKCIICIKLLLEKNGDITTSDNKILYLAGSIVEQIYLIADEKPRLGNKARMVLDEFATFDDTRLSAIINVKRAVHGDKTEMSVSALLESAIKYRLNQDFLELIWLNRTVLSDVCACDIIYEYLSSLNNCNYYFPILKHDNSSQKYEKSRTCYFVDLLKRNDELLKYFYWSSSNITTNINYEWVLNGDWERFVKYNSQVINNWESNSIEGMGVWRNIETLMDGYRIGENWGYEDSFGRSWAIVTNKNIEEFETSLMIILSNTEECRSYSAMKNRILDFLKNTNRNEVPCEKHGVKYEINNKTPEEQFKSYVHNFLLKGINVHDANDEYKRIQKLLSNNKSQTNGITISVNFEKIINILLDEGIDSFNTLTDAQRNKLADCFNSSRENKEKSTKNNWIHQCVFDKEIAEFYFSHCIWEQAKKAEMLSDCIKNQNYERAFELIDLLLKTTTYDEYKKDGRWEYSHKSTIEAFIRECIQSCKNNHEAVQVVNDIAVKVLPHLSIDKKEKINVLLLELQYDEVATEQYIQSLIDDVKTYTSFPKPRGTAAPINKRRIEEKITGSFHYLAKIRRLDVISSTIALIIPVRKRVNSNLIGNVIGALLFDLTDEDLRDVIILNKKLFDEWIKTDIKDDDRLIKELEEKYLSIIE